MVKETSSDGLIYGYCFDGQGGASPVGWSELAAASEDTRVVWVHFEYTAPAVQQWLEQDSGLDPLVVEALLAEDVRPRTTPMGDALLLALRGVNLSHGHDPEDMVAIRIWSDGRRIISTRRRRLRSAGDIADALEQGQGPEDAGAFLSQLAERLILRMRETIEEKADLVAEIEETMLADEGYGLRTRIGALRRDLISLRRYLAPQREALQQLVQAPVRWLRPEARQHLREVADQLSRYLEELDAVRERAAVAQEELASRLAEQMNNRMYALSLVAAVFLPLGFLTGLLGINVGGIPGADNPLAFWLFVALLVLLVGLQFVWLRLKRWF